MVEKASEELVRLADVEAMLERSYGDYVWMPQLRSLIRALPRHTSGEGLREALEVIAQHGDYTKLHPDENETAEVQAAYSEGVTAGYQELARYARAALAKDGQQSEREG